MMKRSPAQDEQLQLTDRAVRILKEAGIECKTTEYFFERPDQNTISIFIKVEGIK